MLDLMIEKKLTILYSNLFHCSIAFFNLPTIKIVFEVSEAQEHKKHYSNLNNSKKPYGDEKF